MTKFGRHFLQRLSQRYNQLISNTLQQKVMSDDKICVFGSLLLDGDKNLHIQQRPTIFASNINCISRYIEIRPSIRTIRLTSIKVLASNYEGSLTKGGLLMGVLLKVV